MATADAAATLERADDFSADYTTATLTIKSGANTLATHTLAGFVTSNDTDDGLATANTIADVSITGTGTQTADSAVVTAGGKSYTLTVGTSGADLNLSTLTYVNGETSSITSFVVRFPA